MSSKRQLVQLWREFIPLSFSDVTMALGDPLTTTTLAHLPAPLTNIAAVGVARAIAIFCESPIIMLLHASNVLAPSQTSRRALWQFTIIASSMMSLLLALTATPAIFTIVGEGWLGVDPVLSTTIRTTIAIAFLWPLAIGWRRYYQGLLIHSGHSQAIAKSGIVRLLMVGGILAGGYALQAAGAITAGLSLVGGVIAEALAVTYLAKKLGATNPPSLVSQPELPQNLAGVWKFYAPLGSTMILVWGARVVLVGIIARAGDGKIALAAWPAAWGLVLVIANSTRMVQQIVIHNRQHIPDRVLVLFSITVGIFFSATLLSISGTSLSTKAIGWFVGSDEALIARVRPVLSICAVMPLLVAVQNAVQGFLVSEGRTWGVNRATWVSATLMLGTAYWQVQIGQNGAIAAAIGMMVGGVAEISYLFYTWRRKIGKTKLS